MTKLVVALIAACLFAGCAPSGSPSSKPSTDGTVGTKVSTCETTGPLQIAPNSQGRYNLVTLPPRKDQFCALILPFDSGALNGVDDGRKTVDYRRSYPTDRISHILFYDTRTQSLTAIAEVTSTLAGSPPDLVNQTLLRSGRNLNSAKNFFSGRGYGFAIEFQNFHPLTKPITLAEARAMDSKFQRPYGYLFLDRHPVLNGFIQQQLADQP